MNTRQQIIAAAIEVMQTKGLVETTTREIARAANCAEGTLYNHFASKEALFVEMLTARLSGFVNLLEKQLEHAGEGELADNLAHIALAAMSYYEQMLPLASSFFADLALLERYQAKMRELDTGPQRIILRVTAYVQAEQRFGRISKQADAQAVAMALIGPCFQYAYINGFAGADALPVDRQTLVTDLVKTVLRGCLSEALRDGM